MKLKLTRHFQYRMSQRGISIDHVKQAVMHPDKVENTYENKMKAVKRIGEKTIEVVYCREGFKDKNNEYLLITAYYL